MSERDITNRLRRAVKENNLALVKRLIQRTDIRNPDPGPERYTSLAWAAVLGHEESFEYLLQMGHDDEELSKDSENNTILIILAGLGSNSVSSPYRSPQDDPDLQDTAMRMARQYWERFPFITDWSNLQGRTALHVAALKGSEDFVRMICDLGADVDLTDTLGNTALHYASAWGHISVVQLLIERGCAFNPKNNEGFTASDYAYSHNTQEALQETARTQWETNKKARVIAQHEARNGEMRERYHSPDDLFGEIPPTRRILQSSRNRLRSGSATTSTSDSTDYEGQLSTSAPIHGSSGSSSQFSSHSSGSLPRAPPSNGTVLTPIPSSSNQGILPPTTATSRLRPHQPSSSASTTSTQSSKPSTPSGTTPTANGRMTPQNGVAPGTSSTSISHFAARTLERDADAMAQYLMRARSSSNSSANSTPTAPAYIPPQASPFTSESTLGDLRGRNTLPRLKPSISTTSLRTGSQTTTPIATRPPGPSLPPDDSRSNSRIRATTLNNGSGQTTATRSPPMPTTNLPGAPPGSPPAHRRQGFTLPLGRVAESAQAAMNGSHGRRPSGSLLKEITTLRINPP